ncbi:MAG: aryl-alcohol dehydrogenase-like predicted oxidoreductase [Paracoccaceae bacterium]|jgi:aryl-alcohol dehydrogenase-like predicted oxidoreductase
MTNSPLSARVPLGPVMQVSRLCLGTMMFGDQTDEPEAAAILSAFKAAGGNFIDTADAYTDGASEDMLGRLIADDRKDWVLATKLGNKIKGQGGGLSPAWIDQALDASLGRLGTDVIDLYYLHLDDEETPLKDTIAAMGAAMADGRIKAWGFSNFRAWKIAEIIRIADDLGVARPVVAQPYYHALYREIEKELLPACDHFGIAVVPYSPLARGVLTGKYTDGIPEGSRGARGDVRISQTEMRPELIAAAARIDAHARATGRKTADLALQWVLANRIITSVLIGPKSLVQLQAYLGSMAATFTPEDEAAFEAVVPTGAVVGTFSDPRYPYRGRRVA